MSDRGIDRSCPILIAKGEQGAGKTTAAELTVRSLIHVPEPSRGVPREVRDLVAAARNSWLVCFGNLGQLPDDLADAACRLATGGGGTARPDFLDRALIVEFLNLKPAARRDEAQFWREFEEARPQILGALLDATVAGLRNLAEVRLDRLPRMADFAIWVSACEPALDMEPGEALTSYRANCAEARNLTLEASPLYEPIRMLARPGFTGTISELLYRLNALTHERTRRSNKWPKAPNVLGSALRRIALNLRSAGIDVDFSRPEHGGRRLVSIHSNASDWKTLSRSSPPARRDMEGPQTRLGLFDSGDDGDDGGGVPA